MNKIKLLLADDEELFRKGISFLLQRQDNIQILYEANNGSEVVEYLKSSSIHPDIILMDLKMPMLNGVEATKLINKEFPSIKIIALTSYNTKSFIANMIEIGAASYIVKNSSPEEMITTINQVIEKGFYYNEEVLNVIQENLITNNRKNIFFEDIILTKREREILELICYQNSTQQIADKLFIIPRTVEGHRNNLLLKTDSQNSAGLVVFAITVGVLQFSPSSSENMIESSWRWLLTGTSDQLLSPPLIGNVFFPCGKLWFQSIMSLPLCNLVSNAGAELAFIEVDLKLVHVNPLSVEIVSHSEPQLVLMYMRSLPSFTSSSVDSVTPE
jgi:DNA-binding NarL/FixJ family response regulator